MEFSDKILDYINKKGTLPSYLAKEIGIDKSTFSKWKTKPTSKLDLDIVVKIASYFNVSIDSIIIGKEKSSSSKLSPDEQELLSLFRNLNAENRIRVTERARTLSELAQEDQYQSDEKADLQDSKIIES